MTPYFVSPWVSGMMLHLLRAFPWVSGAAVFLLCASPWVLGMMLCLRLAYPWVLGTRPLFSVPLHECRGRQPFSSMPICGCHGQRRISLGLSLGVGDDNLHSAFGDAAPVVSKPTVAPVASLVAVQLASLPAAVLAVPSSSAA